MDKNAVTDKSEKWLEREGREIISVNSDQGKVNATFSRWAKIHRPSKYLQKIKEKSLRLTQASKDTSPKEYIRKRKPLRLPPLAPQRATTDANSMDMDTSTMSGLPTTKTKLPPIKPSGTQQSNKVRRDAKDRSRFLTKTLSSSDIKTAEFLASRESKPGAGQKKKSNSSRRNVESSSSDQRVREQRKNKQIPEAMLQRKPFVVSRIVNRKMDKFDPTNTPLSTQDEPKSAEKNVRKPQNKPSRYSAQNGLIPEYLNFNLNSAKLLAPKTTANKTMIKSEEELISLRTKHCTSGETKFAGAEKNKFITYIGNSDQLMKTSAVDEHMSEKQLCASLTETKSLGTSGTTGDEPSETSKKRSGCNQMVTENLTLTNVQFQEKRHEEVDGYIKTAGFCETTLATDVNPTTCRAPEPCNSDASTASLSPITAADVPDNTGGAANLGAPEFPNPPLNAWGLNQEAFSESSRQYENDAKPVSSEGGSVELLKFYRDNFPLLLRNIESTENFPCMPRRSTTPDIVPSKRRHCRQRKSLAELEASLTKADLVSGNVGIEILRKSHDSRDFKRLTKKTK